MEEVCSLWSYQESNEELKQKLLCTAYELESARTEATEEIRKNKESVKQLLNLLQIAYQERDEARNQLQKVIDKIMPATPIDQFFKNSVSSLAPQSPLINPLIANSSITESNSHSETYNLQSNNSALPVDSFFDSGSSRDPSAADMEDSSDLGFLYQPLAQDFNGSSLPNTNMTPTTGLFSREANKTEQDFPRFSLANSAMPTTGLFSREMNKVDHQDLNRSSSPNTPVTQTTGFLSRGKNKVVDQDSLIIYNLSKGRPLPHKGKLLQAVIEAGPLLQTLMVAGPLPQWRNPPPLETFEIPAVSIKGLDCEIMGPKKNLSNGNNSGKILMKSSNYAQISCGSSQIYPTSMLNIAGGSSGSNLNSWRVSSSGVHFSNRIPMTKRQRIQ
ncbi:hypothetical protein Nepgr_009270 [Nepenthes gracilis]|uniref:Uncharacterized protein n=1 Tax=Nepenthes gracilis TaxID=150966 RepID=A0AAD3SA69_NEPGR|nr:hypothetical protein Nepgr_009270 [Nepenthes gracilis]